MSTTQMIHDLRKMQSQVIHGTKLFGEIADRLENYRETIQAVTCELSVAPLRDDVLTAETQALVKGAFNSR